MPPQSRAELLECPLLAVVAHALVLALDRARAGQRNAVPDGRGCEFARLDPQDFGPQVEGIVVLGDVQGRKDLGATSPNVSPATVSAGEASPDVPDRSR